MITAYDFRAQARKNLQGKWEKVLLLALLCASITFVFDLASSIYLTVSGVNYNPAVLDSFLAYAGSLEYGIANLITLVGYIVSAAIVISETWIYLCVAYEKTPNFKSFAYTLHRAWESFVFNCYLAIRIFLWTLLLIVPGIIKAFEYSQAIYIKIENPGMSSDEAIKRSCEMMAGNKLRLFYLILTFFGWFFLAGIFTTCATLVFGEIAGSVASIVGITVASVYLQTTLAIFYRSLKTVETGNEMQYANNMDPGAPEIIIDDDKDKNN